MPGSGKTTVGKILGSKLSAKFMDTDQIIEEQSGMRIEEIFEKFGEREFRELEKEVIASLSQTTNAVISTGGGTILNSENFKVLSALGKTIALNAPVKTLWKRLQGQPRRPLLLPQLFSQDRSSESNETFNEQNEKWSQEVLTQLLSERLPYYKKADYQIETKSKNAQEVADLIIGMIKS
jgi:shikimate kinase